MAYGFDVDRLLVWLAPRDPERRPAARRLVVQAPRRRDGRARGWTLDDRREASRACSARRQRPSTTGDAAGRRRLRRPARQRRPRRLEDAGAERAARSLDATCRRPRRRRGAAAHDRRRGHRRAVADDDPDATQAIPWLPTFDDDDDLGGVLAAAQPAARPGVPRHRPQALMQTTASLFIDGASRPTCSSRWRRSTATRRGCASSTASSRSSPTTAGPAWRVELRARVGPFARSKQLRMVRTVHEPGRIACASSASRTTSATTPSGCSRPRSAPADGGATRGDRAAATAAALWGRRAGAGARRRDPARQGRAAPASSASSPRAEAPVRPALERRGAARTSRSARRRRGRRRSARRARIRPSRSSSACVVVGGMSSTWWVTTTDGGAAGSAARSSSAATSCSRPPRSRRADGSSSSTTAGSFISVRASSTRWRSPDDSVPSSRSAKRADAHPLEARARLVVVGGGVRCHHGSSAA